MADAPGIAEIYDPVVTDTVISFEMEPPPVGEIERRIRATLATHPWLVCEGDGRITGYAYATVFRKREAYQWSTEVSAYVHPDFQRRGIARALYSVLFTTLQRQGFLRLFAGIALPNEASITLHENFGFESVGVLKGVGFKFSAWHDVGWWQKSLVDDSTKAATELSPTSSPTPPTPFAEIAGAPWLAELLEQGSSLPLPGG